MANNYYDLKKMYSDYNKQYFNNILPKTLPVSYSSKLKAGGVAKGYKKNGVLYPRSIEINKNMYHNERSLTAVLLHEMCHIYNYQEDNYSGHGKPFKAIVKKINNQNKDLKVSDKAVEMDDYEFHREKRPEQYNLDPSKNSKVIDKKIAKSTVTKNVNKPLSKKSIKRPSSVTKIEKPNKEYYVAFFEKPRTDYSLGGLNSIEYAGYGFYDNKDLIKNQFKKLNGVDRVLCYKVLNFTITINRFTLEKYLNQYESGSSQGIIKTFLKDIQKEKENFKLEIIE